jgi:hypothetical protein
VPGSNFCPIDIPRLAMQAALVTREIRRFGSRAMVGHRQSIYDLQSLIMMPESKGIV